MNATLLNQQIEHKKQRGQPQPKERKLSLTVKSEHLQEYQELLKEYSQQQTELFPSNEHIYCDQDNHQNFSFWVASEFNSYEIVSLDVRLGAFALDIKILNVSANSPLSKRKAESQGKFGRIHFVEFHGIQVAIKSAHYFSCQEEQKRKVISNVLQEYCISKICDLLECGPKILNPFGFDLIAYNDCIEFALEKCSFLTGVDKSDEEQLLKMLVKLHNHRIVHLDIKPENIMFSPSHNKVVFIDFGLSRIIKQDRGYKTQTTFCGTPRYVSLQMLRLFSIDNETAYVDLYYNDLVCLQKVLSELKRIQLNKNEQRTMKNEEQINESESQKSFYGDIWFPQQQREKKEEEENNLKEEYQLAKLKYYSLFEREKVLPFLQKYKQSMLKFMSIGRKMLRHFSALLPSDFFSEIVFKELSLLSQQAEHAEFLNLFKKTKQKAKLRIRDTQKIENSQFRSRFILNQLLQLKKDLQDNQPLIIQELQSQQFYNNIEDKTVFYSLLFDSIRFDRKNIELRQKVQLANCFLKFIDKENQIHTNSSLASLKFTFKYLLNFCLNAPLTDWKKQNRCHFLIQALLIEADIREQLELIRRWMLKGECDCWQKLRMFLEVYELQGLLLLIHKNNEQELSSDIKKAIKTILVDFSEYTEQMQQKSQNSDQKLISHFLKENKRVKIQNLSLNQTSASNLLSQIKNVKNRCLVKKFYLINYIRSAFQSTLTRNYFSIQKDLIIKQQFQENPQIKIQNLAEHILFNTIISFSFLKFKSQDDFILALKELINCDFIFQRFVFKFQISNAANQLQLRSYIEELLTACFDQNQHQHFLPFLRQIPFQLDSTEENTPLKEKIAAYFLKFYDQFYRIPIQLQHSLINESKIISTEYYIFFSSLSMYLISNDYINSIKQCLAQLQQKVKKRYWRTLELLQHSGDLSQEAKCNQINVQLILIKKARQQNDLDKYYLYSKRQLQIQMNTPHLIYMQGTILNYLIFTNSLSDSFIPQTASILFQDIFERRELVLIWLWKYLQVNRYMIAYFFSNTNQYSISQTLSLLWRKKDKYGRKCYQFLRQIIELLSQYPTLQNSQTFINNIDCFYQEENTHQFFDFETVKQQIGPITWNNRYCMVVYARAILKTNTLSEKFLYLEYWKIIKQVDTLRFMSKCMVLSYLMVRLITRSYRLTSEAQRQRKTLYLLLKYYLKYFHQATSTNFTDFLKIIITYFKLKSTSKNLHKQNVKDKMRKYLANLDIIIKKKAIS